MDIQILAGCGRAPNLKRMGDSADQVHQAIGAPMHRLSSEADKGINRRLLMEVARTVVEKLDSTNEVIDLAFSAEVGYNHIWLVTFIKVLTIPWVYPPSFLILM